MPLEAHLAVHGHSAEIELSGDLDDDSVPLLRSVLNQATGGNPDRIVLRMTGLTSISSAGIRCLIAIHQTMPSTTALVFAEVPPATSRALQLAGVAQPVSQLLH